MFTFSIPFLINFISAILMVGMGYFVLHRNSRDYINHLFTLITIFGAFWVFSSALSDVTSNLQLALILADTALFPPFLILGLMYIFALHFPYQRRKMSKWEKVIVFLPIFAVVPFLYTKYNIESVSFEPWGTSFVPGPLYVVLFAYILTMFGMSSREMHIKRKETKDPEKRAQIAFLFYAFLSMVGLGLVANLILPLFGQARWSTIGPSSTLLFVVFTTYAIVKHHLLDVKVIAAEFFSAAVTLFMFLQIFGATSPANFILRIGVFIITTFFALLLLRSVIQEVKQRREVQRLAGQLQASNKRLRRLDTMKTTMVSIASHQLRGPLGGMRGYFTMFRDGDLGPLTDKQREIVKMNLNTLSRLLNAVETFLDITKLEAGKMVLRKEVLPLDEAVHDVAHEFEIMLSRKGLELKTEIEDHVWVEFDPEKIKHVIFNLVDNAMKYTESGWIKVSLNKEGDQAVVRVSDSGKGIPAEDLPRLFGKFQRGELAVDRGGSGLGLYVVKMLTEMQNGTVSVSSPGVGKGTTFTVELPLSKDHH